MLSQVLTRHGPWAWRFFLIVQGGGGITKTIYRGCGQKSTLHCGLTYVKAQGGTGANMDIMCLPEIVFFFDVRSVLRMQATSKRMFETYAEHDAWRACILLCRATPRLSLKPSKWVDAYEKLITHAVESGDLSVRTQLDGIQQISGQTYLDYAALQMKLVRLPRHGLLASLSFGLEERY